MREFTVQFICDTKKPTHTTVEAKNYKEAVFQTVLEHSLPATIVSRFKLTDGETPWQFYMYENGDADFIDEEEFESLLFDAYAFDGGEPTSHPTVIPGESVAVWGNNLSGRNEHGGTELNVGPMESVEVFVKTMFWDYETGWRLIGRWNDRDVFFSEWDIQPDIIFKDEGDFYFVFANTTRGMEVIKAHPSIDMVEPSEWSPREKGVVPAAEMYRVYDGLRRTHPTYRVESG